MITTANYIESTKSMNIPAPMKEAHDFVVENLDLYGKDEDIDSLIDLHIKELNRSGEEKKAPVQKTEPKPQSKKVDKLKSVKKEAVTKQAVKKATPAKTVTKPTVVDKPVDEVTPDLIFIKKWLGFNGKVKTKRAILTFLKSLQKAIADKTLRSTMSTAELIKEIQTKCTSIVSELSSDESKIKLEFTKATLEKYKQVVGSTSPYKSVNLIKRFISLIGSSDKVKIQRLKFALDKTKLDKNDPYISKIEQIKKLVEVSPIAIKKQELSGLEAIIEECGCKDEDKDNKALLDEIRYANAVKSGKVNYENPSHLGELTNQIGTTPQGVIQVKPGTYTLKEEGGFQEEPLFVKASEKEVVKKKSADVFRLKGEIGEFLQDIQKYKYAIALTGDSHAGKSELLLQMLDAFAQTFDNIIHWDLEQGGLSSKDTQAAYDRNVKPKNKEKIFVAGSAPKGFDSIREFAAGADVVAIDSFQKLDVPNTYLDKLRNEFPQTIFIVILQQNSAGGTRGGVTADYDANVRIKVHKVDSTFVNNYAELLKNRNNKIGLKYNMSLKKIVQ